MTRLALTASLVLLAGCGRTEVYRFRAAVTVDAGVPEDCEDIVCPASSHCVGGACVCDDGFEADGGSCHSIAVTLAGLRWELPCNQLSPQAPEYVCFTAPTVTKTATLGGSPSKLYEISLRLRGVVETKAYSGGIPRGGTLLEGGVPIDDAWNIYRLQILKPSATWYVNSGATGEYLCHAIDQVLTVRANGGTVFTLFASSVDSNLSEIRNIGLDAGAIVLPGVPPSPAPFDGQFVQMDVLSVTEVP
jgi:hypothetical protein